MKDFKPLKMPQQPTEWPVYGTVILDGQEIETVSGRAPNQIEHRLCVVLPCATGDGAWSRRTTITIYASPEGPREGLLTGSLLMVGLAGPSIRVEHNSANLSAVTLCSPTCSWNVVVSEALWDAAWQFLTQHRHHREAFVGADVPYGKVRDGLAQVIEYSKTQHEKAKGHRDGT